MSNLLLLFVGGSAGGGGGGPACSWDFGTFLVPINDENLGTISTPLSPICSYDMGTFI